MREPDNLVFSCAYYAQAFSWAAEKTSTALGRVCSRGSGCLSLLPNACEGAYM